MLLNMSYDIFNKMILCSLDRGFVNYHVCTLTGFHFIECIHDIQNRMNGSFDVCYIHFQLLQFRHHLRTHFPSGDSFLHFLLIDRAFHKFLISSWFFLSIEDVEAAQTGNDSPWLSFVNLTKLHEPHFLFIVFANQLFVLFGGPRLTRIRIQIGRFHDVSVRCGAVAEEGWMGFKFIFIEVILIPSPLAPSMVRSPIRPSRHNTSR